MNPKVVQHSPHTIERIQVEQILAMRESRKALQDRLELVEKALDDAEDGLINLIGQGADLSRAGYALSVSQSERRYPKWRELYVELTSSAEADRILESTKPTISRRLVVK